MKARGQRTRSKLAGLLLLAFLCLTGTGIGQDSAFPAKQSFLNKLYAGTTPTACDFPNLAACWREVDRDWQSSGGGRGLK